MFAAEASSRGCTVFVPLGGDAEGIDLILLTPTQRMLKVQVKTQATAQFATVRLYTNTGKHPKLRADVWAVFNDGWHLVPYRAVAPAFSHKLPTLNVSVCRRYKDNWKLLR